MAIDYITAIYNKLREVFPSSDTLITDNQLLLAESVAIGDGYASDAIEIVDAFIGSIRGTVDITLDSSGATIELELQAQGGGDIRVLTPNGFETVDTTPAISVSLSAGTTTVPVLNYVYLDLDSSNTLTASTTGWGSGNYAPIATVLVLDRATTNAYGSLKTHAYIDHISNGSGHIIHIGKKLRVQPANWQSGVNVTTSPSIGSSASTVSIATSSGVVFQLHEHSFSAFNAGTEGHNIVNHPTTPFVEYVNLGSATTDSTGASLSNKHYSLVVWAVASEKTEDDQIMVNLPSGSYNTSASASKDAERYTDYSIPVDFVGVGFLLARVQLKHNSGAGTWTVNAVEDLRGLNPSTAPGSGAGVTQAADLSDYATGTWTPELRDHVGNTLSAGSHLYQDGTYTKIGNLVFFSCRVGIGATITPLVATNAIRVYGIPYTHADAGSTRTAITVGFGFSMSMGTAGYSPAGFLQSSYIQLKLWDSSSGASDLLVQELSTNGYLYISGTYRTA